MDNLSQVHPPFYIKHKEKGKFLFSGPFVTMGGAQSEISRCEYNEKGIEYEIVGLDEKNRVEAEQVSVEEETPSKRGPGRPRKLTPIESETDESAG